MAYKNIRDYKAYQKRYREEHPGLSTKYYLSDSDKQKEQARKRYRKTKDKFLIRYNTDTEFRKKVLAQSKLNYAVKTGKIKKTDKKD